MPELKSGDLVIHAPADPAKLGAGPYYVDRVESSGDTQIQVSWLVYGPLAWSFSIPRDEAEVVGHYEVPGEDRFGHAFSPRVLEEMKPIMEQGRNRLFELYPLLKERAEAEAAERAADEAATADQLSADRCAAGFDAYRHILRRGQRVVWYCGGHSTADTSALYYTQPRPVRDCAELELERRRAEEAGGTTELA
jgi:hypothetical protein